MSGWMVGEWGGEEQCLDGWWVSGVGMTMSGWMVGEWGGDEQCLDGWWVSGVGMNNVWMDGG